MPAPAARPLRLFAAAARTLGDGLLRVIYPPCCLGCDRPLDSHAGPLCPACLRRPERADPAEVAAQLGRLPAEARHLDSGFALWVFDKGGVLQQVHHALKYGNRPRYGLRLGEWIGRAYRDHPPTPDALDLIVPVPLHRARRYERGYNQSAMLARGLARALACPVAEALLVRPRATRTQTRLARPQRWTNVRQAFEARHPERIAGRRLLLVDDVLTTGATAAAAAHVLKEAGAAAVHLAALALARM